ncbi:uncharacterized Zn finger protein (UPF0148 family) [Bacillus fengqiuensis]|nr:uncharacterized Zn finger protein (UPF0148 family) [Bacillus fengqiuensis]
MKYCPSCGTPLSERAKFCTSCGSPIKREEQATVQQISAALEAGEMSEQRKEVKATKNVTKKNPFILVLVIILLGVSGTAVFLLHKSPKELYLLAEYSTYKEMQKEWDSRYGDSIEFQERMLEKPSTSEVMISGNIEMDSAEEDPDFEMIQELLSQASITAETSQDPLKNEGYYKLALNMDEEKAMDVEVYQSDEQLGLKIPMLYKKFFYLNFSEYGEFMHMIDPDYTGPETLEFSQLELQELQLTDKEKEYLKKSYAQFLLAQLKDENFTLEKGVQYEHEGQKMKLRKVTLALSPMETRNLVNQFIDHIIEDKELHNMIVVRAEKLAKAAAIADEVNEEDLNPAEMKRELVKGLKEAKSEMKSLRYPEGFTSALLIDSHEQIVDREVKTSLAEGTTDQINVLVTSKNISYDKNKKLNELKVELTSEEDDDTKVIFHITNDGEDQTGNRSEKLTASFYVESYGEVEDEINFTMATDVQGKMGDKQDIKREFELELLGSEFEGAPNGIKGTIQQISDINLKKEQSNQKVEIEVGVEDEYDSGTVTLNIDSSTKLKNSVNMPQLKADSSDGINIANISEDEMYEIQEEIGSNLTGIGEKFGFLPEEDDEYSDYEYEDYSDEGYY